MNRDDEDRILHGLYYYRQSIEEEMSITAPQLLWLAMHPLPEGASWNADGKLQSVDSSAFPSEIQLTLLTAKIELPLRYLQYRRLIRFNDLGDDGFSVAVTFAGADRAIRLHTLGGRMDLWFRDHKDGVFGLAITVLVAMLTALITVKLMR